ncbi:MAG: radical SAM protein [Anaerolineales bacterium]
MKAELQFLYTILTDYPQFLKITIDVGQRNLTGWLDYHLADGRSRPPKALIFKVINICNMNCKMCVYSNAGYFEEGISLPKNLFQEVIQAAQNRIPIIALTGGEPLLHKDIFNFIRYAKNHNFCCTMVTNGWFLKENAAEIADSGLDLLTVSIDGPGNIHDRIRRKPGAFDRAMEGIQELLSYKKRPMLVINSIIQSDNCRHLDQLVSEIEDVGIDAMNIQLLWTRSPERASKHNLFYPDFQVGNGWIDESIMDIDFELLKHNLERIKERNILVNLYPPFDFVQIQRWYTGSPSFEKDIKIKCSWMWAIIFQDGTMRMCDDIVLGDLHEERFWEIWNGERMVKFRNTLKEHQRFPICAGCCNLYRNRKI